MNAFSLIIGLIIAAVVGHIVQEDAKKIGCSKTIASLWGLGTFLILILVLPAYLLFRYFHTSGHQSEQGNRKCPLCAETIKREARLCKHCKSEITPLPDI